MPQKENNEKLIEDSRKLIAEKNAEKNIIKAKRNDEEKPMIVAKELRAKKNIQLDEALKHSKESIKKAGNTLSKLNEKDLVDCKNTWENFNFGRFLLSKIFEILKDPNFEDFDYIKKNISVKHFKKLTNIDYTKVNQQYKDIVKSIVSSPDFIGSDKFNKPYKLAGLICDYFTRVHKFNKVYEENNDLVEEIAELEKKIEGHQNLLNKYLENYKGIENEIINIESQISNYEINKANSQMQIDKIKSLNKAYSLFIQLTNEKEDKYREKTEYNLNLLHNFDYYIVYIASYLSFAPILNYHYRFKLKSFIIQNINTILEEINLKKKEKHEENDELKELRELNGNEEPKQIIYEIKDMDFSELMFNFLEINGDDKELFTNSGIYNEFLKENFIFLHMNKGRVPFILDYTQSAKEIIKEYLEFDKMPNFTMLSYNNNSEQTNEYKEKLENSLKLGSNLFIYNISNINKIYYQFTQYINQRFSTNNSKKYVNIDEHKYEIHDNFKLYLFKNIYGNKVMKIDSNIWFSMIFVNFNLSKEEIQNRLFLDLSKTRNELAYNGFKKFRNEKIKQSLIKIDTEKKIINTILQFDLSGNVEKLVNTEALNEKYKTENILHSNCVKSLEILENKLRKQKSGLNDNYSKICKDCSKIFKWLYKFCFFHTSYLVQSSTLTKLLIDFIQEKISIHEELKNLNELQNNIDDDEFLERKKFKRLTRRHMTKPNNNNDNTEQNASDEEEEYEEENEIGDNNENKEHIESNIHEKVNPVVKELYIYNNTKDAKSLLIYLYNKINSLFTNNSLKQSLLLVFAFICVNLENKLPIPFKKCFLNSYLFLNKFDECFDESEIENSPINNINNKQWSILKKINLNSGQLFQDIFDNIEKNKEKWNKYLEDSLSDLNNNYFLNNLVFPDEELENLVNPLIKFLFFYIVKPQKREFLIQIFIKNTIKNTSTDPQVEDILFIEKNNSKEFYSHMLKSKIDDLDITKAFKNFNPYKEHALVLIAPSNNMNIYDKLLYDYCYLKMFSSNKENNLNNSNVAESKLDKSIIGAEKTLSNKVMNENIVNVKENINIKIEYNQPLNNLSSNQQQKQGQEQGQGQGQVIPYISEVKYKEIVLENNIDLTQQDFEYIKNIMKIGGVIIIKNAHLLGHLFSELIKEMLQMKPDDFSSNFKFILICNIDEIMKNKNLYEQCRIINDNLISENDLDEEENILKLRKVKDNVLNLVAKIPIHIYSLLLNTHLQFLRLFIRKLIYSYIIIFAVLESTELKNPFKFGRKDFYALCKFLITYIEGENFTEEKYKNDFINVENTTGFNYMTLILVINNIFIFTRQIDQGDECKVNKLVSDIFNFKIFMSPEFYLDIGNIKINIKQSHGDLNFEEVYKDFDHFFSQEYENLIPNQSIEELKEKSEKYTDNIFNNIINVIDYNHEKYKVNTVQRNIDYAKLHVMLTKFKELIPSNIQYLHQEDVIDLENKENEINASLFKRNKFGLYFNAFDESLLYEIVNFNKKLETIHNELDILIGMLEGKFAFDDYHFKVFEILGRGRVPKEVNIFYDINYFNKNIKFSLYKEVLLNRISILKQWLRDGNMKYFHLPIFSNIELFIYTIKMYFCRKYYGENDYAKVTPDMLTLKFISTKYPTYEELVENERDFNYYNSAYHNEIIWVDGLVLNNATIDPTNKHLLFSNLQNNIKQKLNLVGITYNVQHYENDEYSENVEEEVEENKEEEEEEKEEEKENEEEEEKSEMEEKEEKKEDKKENKEKKEGSGENNQGEDFKAENQSVKIYIYGNKNDILSNKYYKEDPIGFFEFRMFNSDLNGQSYIYEHEIRVTVEDYDDFVKAKK